MSDIQQWSELSIPLLNEVIAAGLRYTTADSVDGKTEAIRELTAMVDSVAPFIASARTPHETVCGALMASVLLCTLKHAKGESR
jgi:hypothetical protein